MKEDAVIKKKSRKIGLILAASWCFIIAVIARIKHGPAFLFHDYLYIGLPLWTFLMYYSAHGAAKAYFTRKKEFSDFFNKDSRKAKIEWGREKIRFSYKALRTIAYMFGAATPLYFLAYFDDSVYLKSSVFLPFLFLFISSTSLIASVYLKKRYKFIS